MGALTDELRRGEAAARADTGELRARIAQLAGRRPGPGSGCLSWATRTDPELLQEAGWDEVSMSL